MRRIETTLLITALAVFALAPTAAAQERGKRKAVERRQAEPAQAAVTLQITAAERDVIARYYAAHPYKAKRLPPGVAKNLVRGKPLPPGIARRQLPAALLTQLPRRSGVEIAVYGDRIVLLNDRGLVLDVMVDLFR